MGRLPLILISPSIFKRGVEFHDRSISLSVKYEDSILQAGGIPFIVPSTVDRALLAEIVRRVDGVVLSGGDDLNPGLYAKKLPRAVRQTIEQTPDGGATCAKSSWLMKFSASASRCWPSAAAINC